MKLVDANILLYAINPSEARNETARSWLDGSLSRTEPIGFAWIVLVAFLRVSSTPGAFARPLSVEVAAATVENWIEQPSAVVVEPTPRHWVVLRGLLEALGTGDNLVNDAHLATLALEHGAEVVSFDTDFARFPGLRWRMPGEERARRNPG